MLLALFTVLATVTPPTLDLSTVDVNPMLSIIYSFIPAGIPVMLIIMGISIGVGIFRSMLGGHV